MRLNRPKYSDLTEEQRLKNKCRAYTNSYIKRGKLERGVCEVCESDKVEAHHDDYNKPLEVRWFCRKHHLEYHDQLMVMEFEEKLKNHIHAQ